MPTPPRYPFVATVHRPGLADVHLGFAYRHQAEQASRSLTLNLACTAHVEGTTITWSPTPDSIAPLAPVPTDVLSVADLMDEADHLPSEHRFPDLFARLTAQEGYEAAAVTWRAACSWLDGGPEPCDDESGN